MSDFNRGWIFYRENGDREIVDLPHDAMLTEPRRELCHNGDKTGYFPGGIYWYEKVFSLTKDEAEQYVELVFEGVYRNAQVDVNGIPAGYHGW